MYDLAKENESHELLAKILMLQAKLALVNGDTKEALHLLHQAKDIASNFNLEQIKLQITFIDSQVQNSLYEATSEIYEKATSTIEERIDDLEVLDYLQNLYYQRKANELLRADLENIRKYNKF